MSILAVAEKKRLERPIRICSICLDILCMDGYLDSNFVISKTTFKQDIKCELCNDNSADFIVIPYERGIYICNHCLRSLMAISKHRWRSWTHRNIEEDIPCDFCGQKATIHIIPPKVRK